MGGSPHRLPVRRLFLWAKPGAQTGWHPLPDWSQLGDPEPGQRAERGELPDHEAAAAAAVEQAISELERISKAVDAETATAVPAVVWKETIERVQQQGRELLEIHRDMYLAAIEEGRLCRQSNRSKNKQSLIESRQGHCRGSQARQLRHHFDWATWHQQGIFYRKRLPLCH